MVLRRNISLKPGDKHRALMRHPKPYFIRILALVEDQVVYRWIGPHNAARKYWQYAVEHRDIVKDRIELAAKKDSEEKKP